MERLILFVGIKQNGSKDILTSWEKLPTQIEVNKVTTLYKDEYREMALMQYILFIQGDEDEGNKNWYDLG